METTRNTAVTPTNFEIIKSKTNAPKKSNISEEERIRIAKLNLQSSNK